MKQIIIINGVYGHRPNGEITVEPKQAGDPAFEVTDEEADRLVGLKVAAIVEVEAQNEVTGKQQSAATQTPATGGADAEHPAYDETMKLDKLKEIAKIYGVGAAILASLKSKKAVIEAIDAQRAADEAKAAATAASPSDDGSAASGNDGEQPPDLGAADPV